MIKTLDEHSPSTPANRQYQAHHETYRLPSTKMPHRTSFCLRGMWRFQMIGIGRTRITKSVKMLMLALAMYEADSSTQFGTRAGSRSQNWSMGVHQKMPTRTVAISHMTMTAMQYLTINWNPESANTRL